MPYPKEKRRTNHPILRFGGSNGRVSWSQRECNVNDVIIRKRGNKWVAIRNGVIIYRGSLNDCRKA